MNFKELFLTNEMIDLYMIILYISLSIIAIFLIYEFYNLFQTKKLMKFLDSVDYYSKIKPLLLSLFETYDIHNIMQCSNQLVSNFSSYKTFNYLVKYFHLVVNDETIYNFECLKRIICDVEVFASSNRNIAKKALNEFPSFTMHYISPRGRSESIYSYILNSENIDRIIDNVNQVYNKQPKFVTERNKLTPIIRDSVLARDNFTCCLCGNSIYKEPNLLLEVDHIIPISKGGKTEPNNLQTLCWKCNRKKSDNLF